MYDGQKKLLILGHKRHGKDTCAELLRDFIGVTFSSSSEKAVEIFIFDALKQKYGYTTPMECFLDRINHRAEWYDLICEYNKDDKAKLAKEILLESDCYVGMRSGEEIKECVSQGLFDLIIWIDASERLPLEPSDSFDIDKSYADVIIDNNGTEEEFYSRVRRFANLISL